LLEDRLAPALQALSLADPSLLATGAGGTVSMIGRTISDDGRYVVFDAGDNIVPGDHNYAPDVFVRDLQTGTVTLVSVNTRGTSGNAGSGPGVITPNGRFVVFTSGATDLVNGDSSTNQNIFVRDLTAGTTTLVSVNTAGSGGTGDSMNPVISSDGRYVAFESYARDLVAGDTSVGDQIYLRDLTSGTTKLASVGEPGYGTFIASDAQLSDNGQFVVFQAKTLFTGANMNIYIRNVTAGTTALVSIDTTGTTSGNGDSTHPVMTPDGRYVAFPSLANNLVPGDTNGAEDIFVRDTVAQKTILVSANTAGGPANDSSGVDGHGYDENPCISSDGRYVAFNSWATNLTSGGSNPLAIFVRDLQTSTTTQVSIGVNGAQPNSFSQYPFMTADGNSVGFESFATNLVNLSVQQGVGNLYVRNRSAGTTSLVTMNAAQTSSTNVISYASTITADGVHVTFESAGQDLVVPNRDNQTDVYVRNLATQTTTLVSTHDPNLPSVTANGPSDLQSVTNHMPQVSNDGRYVAFASSADNLTAGVPTGQLNAYVADRQTGKVTLVSVNAAGTGSGNNITPHVVLSANGRYAAFDSAATNFTNVPDNNNNSDVFERDLQAGTTTLVSLNHAGTATAAGGSEGPSSVPTAATLPSAATPRT
jgi:Tol biopolymer transport system component